MVKRSRQEVSHCTRRGTCAQEIQPKYKTGDFA